MDVSTSDVSVNNRTTKSSRTDSRLAGFTLLELLVVVSVVGVLTALLLPVLSKGRETGRATACLSNLRQVGIGLQLYCDDHGNRLPTMRDRLLLQTNEPQGQPIAPIETNELPTPDFVLSNYLGNVAVLKCPSDHQWFFKTRSSYAWNSLLNGQPTDRIQILGMAFKPHQVPLMYDKEKFHVARGENKAQNFLYADGHIKNLLVLEGATMSFR